MGKEQLIRLGLLFSFTTSAFSKDEGLTVFPFKTIPGGVVVVSFPLKAEEKENSYALSVNAKEVAWGLCPTKKRQLCTFVGVEMDDTPATLSFVVKKTGSLPAETLVTKVVAVGKKNYPKTKLKVAPSHGEVSPEDQKRIDEERAAMKTIYESGAKSFIWEGAFRMPGNGYPTSKFGGQRVFNGKVASTHYGVDLRGNEKSWVLASNAGRVVFAANLFNSGNFVAIDHGGKLFTTYSHLSSFSVKAGDLVTPGQRLGRAGATGRVTGPHLHWSVRTDGLYVDPLTFLRVARSLK